MQQRSLPGAECTAHPNLALRGVDVHERADVAGRVVSGQVEREVRLRVLRECEAHETGTPRAGGFDLDRVVQRSAEVPRRRHCDQLEISNRTSCTGDYTCCR
jgi:hypothetical protein